ncbi:MAG: hypothetical protein IT470_02510 [Pseudomonadales bacterium]|nr:hypothetical protein [Pseudomonadales bacterium]
MKDLISHGDKWKTTCAILFASSMSPVYLAHTIGYFDIIGVLATIILIRVSNSASKNALMVAVIVMCLMIHESFFIIFFPTLLIHFYISFKNPESHTAIFSFFGLSITFFIFSFLLANMTMSHEDIYWLHSQLLQRTHEELRGDSFAVLGRKIGDNYEIMAACLQGALCYLNIASSLLVTLPTALLINIATWKLLRPHLGIPVSLLICAASFSPLAMHLLAWDTHRWNALMLTTSFLNYCSVAKRYSYTGSADAVSTPAPPYPVIALLLFLNGASTIGLFESYEVGSFPFVESLASWLSSNIKY